MCKILRPVEGEFAVEVTLRGEVNSGSTYQLRQLTQRGSELRKLEALKCFYTLDWVLQRPKSL